MQTAKALMAVATVALGVSGCATTNFTSIWKAPDAGPFHVKTGDKVVALVLAESPALRRSGEANLADELDERGLRGIPAYTLIKDEDVRDEAKAKAAIEASGAVAVIVMRPKGSEQELSVVSHDYYGSPYYGGFWGGGYYGYGWGSMYDATEVRTDTYVSIETLLYDLAQNKLIWAGQTRTMNPTDVESFVAELAESIAHELRDSGVVKRQ
jgi:hypothetical protein